jgi:hypothetical protein
MTLLSLGVNRVCAKNEPPLGGYSVGFRVYWPRRQAFWDTLVCLPGWPLQLLIANNLPNSAPHFTRGAHFWSSESGENIPNQQCLSIVYTESAPTTMKGQFSMRISRFKGRIRPKQLTYVHKPGKEKALRLQRKETDM